MTTPTALAAYAGQGVTYYKTVQAGTDGSWSLQFQWVCPHAAYQAQVRLRKRLSPSYAVSQGKSDPYNSWVGDDFDAPWTEPTQASAVTRNGSLVTLSAAYSDGFGTNYDCAEYLLRVRSFDTVSGDVSEWASVVFAVVVSPLYTAHLTRHDDYSYTFDGSATNYERGLSVTVYSDNGQVSQGGFSQSFSVELPYQVRKGIKTTQSSWDGGSHAVVKTEDGGFQGKFGPFSIIEEGEEDEGLSVTALGLIPGEGSYPTQPHLAASVDGDALSVVGSVSWTDAYGDTHSLPVEYAEEDGSWVAGNPQLPMGIDLEQIVVARSGSGYAVGTLTFRQDDPARGAESLWLSRGEEHIELRMGIGEPPKWQRSVQTAASTVILEGREKPVSRYGGYTTASWTITFAVRELSTANALAANADWLLRTPDGIRASIAVTSVSCDKDETGWYSVQVSASEVE